MAPPPTVDLRAVVRHYIARHRPRALAELASFRDEPTLEAAVRRAALTLLADGRRDPHHTRRPQELLERAEARLVERLAAIETAAAFSSLYQVIDNAVGHWTGLGHLYVYDAALRIGARKGVLPKVVYLHAGTREGAQKLLDAKKRKTLFPSELIEVAPALAELEAYEIEDVLCIYKDQLLSGAEELDDVVRCWPEESERAGTAFD
ncbi:MAG: hypothetical protein K8M05_24990 [Deltaproteobacteria bacterium]|nr:hypothetical protein [Kofleriaceae bacterium]